MICRQCQKEVPKLRAEAIPNKPTSHYHRDDKNRLWHGNTCPDCYWPKGVGHRKVEADEEELHPDLDFNPDPITTRKCRKCVKFLPTSRYFYHEGCEPRVSDVMEGLGGWV